MRRRIAVPIVLALALAAFAPAGASAAAAPAWQLTVTPMPANFTPGGEGEYLLLATNVGAEATSGEITLKTALPAPLEFLSARASTSETPGTEAPECPDGPGVVVVTCTTTEAVPPGRWLAVQVKVKVPLFAEEEVVSAQASVEGGGAQTRTALSPTRIGPNPLHFGFLPGFEAPINEEDGTAATQAGGHPYQLTVALGFPTEEPGAGLTNAGHPRDVYAELPRGLLGDPAATPVLCTEAELTSEGKPDCPPESQVGLFDLTTLSAGTGIITSQLYNMVPPPGAAASLATNAGGVGIFIHLLAGVRSDKDYGVQSASHDLLALGSNPIFGVQVQVWGDPSSPAHDRVRGVCMFSGDPCPATEEHPAAFLTMPTGCPAQPPAFGIHADSWEEPAPEFEEATASYEGSEVNGCEALEFEPKLSAQPSTDLADSPAGLDVDLHQPQDTDKERLSTAALKDATVALAPGLVANPSQADGLAACSEQQIGYLAEDEEAGIHFSKSPQSCPEAAKLGTMEVTTPLLAEYKNEGTELETDPETGEAIPRPVPAPGEGNGAVYLAEPFHNPFGSLLAIYLVVEDPRSGTVAKLAGKVEPDPKTGQLTTVFEENPELPLEDVRLHLFGGARSSLTTPLTCGAHTTTSTLTPWSSPEGADAHPESSFQTTAEPGGGSCPGSEGAAANTPALSAGTISPQAGAYSPFVLKLGRNDGSQRLSGLDTTLPPGLTGKLAGITECSDAQLAQAKAREHPNMGQEEKEHPSCPSSSEVGQVTVAAGSGPTPFHTQGHAYLAGPYKGAPLSLAVIVPAVAGPFDLGAVLTRVALHLDPATAQIHAVSDPFPQILDGIPLDLRQVSLTMGRPDFTLNPTSCDPMSLTGSATSSLGSVAALSNHFQVGGCSSLKFKPHMTLKLKGGTRRTAHPKLIATVYSQGAGVANLSRVQVKLPASAFLDQAHIRTICTRVQFAAGQGNGAECPKGSIYGEAQVKTPLFDYTLPGKVLLRSSNHKLPDLVIALQGPVNQPIAVELDGKTDSIHGALRNTFEAVPDQPFDQARVVLFGGKRGLVVNSRNLCSQSKRASRANVRMLAQSGKVRQLHPLVRNSCKRHRKGRKRHGHHRHRHGRGHKARRGGRR
jgi:hypothetical protein